MKFCKRSALLRIDRHRWVGPSFSCFLHHFTELGEMPIFALSSDRGGRVGKVLSPLAKTYIYALSHDDTFGPLKSAEGGYEVYGIDSQG